MKWMAIIWRRTNAKKGIFVIFFFLHFLSIIEMKRKVNFQISSIWYGKMTKLKLFIYIYIRRSIRSISSPNGRAGMETVNERGIELMSLALEARVTNKILEIRARFNKEQRIERNEIRRFWESWFFEDRHWFLSTKSLNLSLQMNRTFILDENDTWKMKNG